MYSPCRGLQHLHGVQTQISNDGSNFLRGRVLKKNAVVECLSGDALWDKAQVRIYFRTFEPIETLSVFFQAKRMPKKSVALRAMSFFMALPIPTNGREKNGRSLKKRLARSANTALPLPRRPRRGRDVGARGTRGGDGGPPSAQAMGRGPHGAGHRVSRCMADRHPHSSCSCGGWREGISARAWTIYAHGNARQTKAR